MEAVNTENVLEMDFDSMRKFCFTCIKGHEDKVQLDRELFVTRLGEYAALYQYFSEIYAFLIGAVRRYSELRDPFRKMKAMDKRDCLELVLKCVKMNYDSLSRKVTVLSEEDRD